MRPPYSFSRALLMAALVVGMSLAAHAQAPAWQTAMTMGGNTSEVNATATDRAGNVYIAGDFSGVVNFGGISLTSQTSNLDVFAAKRSPASNSFVWAQRAGGAGFERVNGANVYVTGWFSGFDTAMGSTTLVNAGFRDVYVARLTDMGATGSFAWAQRAGGSGFEQGSNVVVYGNSVYIGGLSLSRTVDFDGHPIVNTGGVGYQMGLFASLADGVATATALASPQQFGLYPNPAHGRTTVQLPAIPGTATATLTVLDALGRITRTQPAATNAKAELDLTGLVPGLYAVRVLAGGHADTSRLVE